METAIPAVRPCPCKPTELWGPHITPRAKPLLWGRAISSTNMACCDLNRCEAEGLHWCTITNELLWNSAAIIAYTIYSASTLNTQIVYSAWQIPTQQKTALTGHNVHIANLWAYFCACMFQPSPVANAAFIGYDLLDDKVAPVTAWRSKSSLHSYHQKGLGQDQAACGGLCVINRTVLKSVMRL